jgi:hypothetical protein
MTFRTAAALLFLLLLAGPARAADASAHAPALFAGYWGEFLEHWRGVFQKQNGIVMGTIVMGAICLFIITRGKWRK